MSRLFRALIVLLALGSCGSRDNTAPRNLDDACSIVTERPQYMRAFRAAERTWGVSPAVLMAMIYQESKFIANNRTPHQFVLGVIPVGRQSSAYGYSQALDGTWADYQQDRGRWRARRDNIWDAADFMGWYMAQTTTETGVRIDDVRNQYLAYHDGRTGYLRGTHNSKAWLLRIANQTRQRANVYAAQLATCRAAR
ncbi:MAG: transglycosylase SLT domain-containing protein [Limimaricola sp.]|uniref:transglycosylase SLT domain-containing protein n=1 Tax=Limimaricola sp. TaxID=2211665 RepID=UPI001DF28F39|nr:transglycosylase SLT domain-containing protein [Limimaricola sp.]MBI1416990.1 transglycosylase SLT domain-containing protein [Limimaricola sp.]